MNQFSFRHKFASIATALGGSVLLASVLAPEAKSLTFNDINPIYNSVANESAINVAIGSGPTSFGYFFNIDTDNQQLNSLGFAAPFTSTSSYDVILWSYANGGLDLDNDYTQLASATFSPSCVGTTCILKDFFYWLEVPTVSLPKTSTDVLRGYVITAVGDFTTQPVFFDGSGAFSADASFDGAGYNFTGGDGFAIPFGESGDIPGLSNNSFAFFNANASLNQAAEVPGPLPLFGAAAAFGWSRRMRRRISVSS
jgi:hypothetical protein